MTVKTVRDQCRERLKQLARRQAQKDARATQVVDYVLRTYLINAPDVEIEAAFADTRGGLDTFYVRVKNQENNVVLIAKYSYQVNHAAGQGLEQVSTVIERDCYDDKPSQVWVVDGEIREYGDIIDALLAATGWTLEDLS